MLGFRDLTSAGNRYLHPLLLQSSAFFFGSKISSVPSDTIAH